MSIFKKKSTVIIKPPEKIQGPITQTECFSGEDSKHVIDGLTRALTMVRSEIVALNRKIGSLNEHCMLGPNGRPIPQPDEGTRERSVFSSIKPVILSEEGNGPVLGEEGKIMTEPFDLDAIKTQCRQWREGGLEGRGHNINDALAATIAELENAYAANVRLSEALDWIWENCPEVQDAAHEWLLDEVAVD